MVVLVLPALMAVVQHADANEYKKIVQPELRRILTMARPVQVISHAQHVTLFERIHRSHRCQ